MFNCRVLAFAVVFVPVLSADSFADPPSAETKQKIVEAYGKIDKLSISCFGYERVAGSDGGQLAIGSVEYRFDRATKQLAIGAEGVPWLLVRNKQLFMRLYKDATGASTYLEINKANTIGWHDIDDAMQIVQANCPLTPPDSLPRCFVLPFLDGGVERLFSGPAELLSEVDPKESIIFGLGHPDAHVTFGGPNFDQQKLDPKKSPICIKSKDGSSDWEYAFDRDSGAMTAAQGTLPSEQVSGIPGRRIEFIMQRQFSFAGGATSAEAHEVAFALPTDAKRVGADGLRASYLAALADSGIEVEKLAEQLKEVEQALKTASMNESELVAQIAQQRTAATVDQKQLKKCESDLEEARAERTGAAYLAKQLNGVINDLQHGKEAAGSRK